MGKVRASSLWIVAFAAAVAFAPTAAVAQEYSQESIATYQRGMEAFNAGNLEEAISLFRESYEVYHGHPNALYNIGQCYERLGDLEQSINYYEQYLATDQAEGRDEVYAHIREMRARKAVFTLRTAPAGAAVTITDANGLPLAEYGPLTTPCELELPPGTFVLHFEAQGYAPRTQVVDGGLGRRAVIDITLAEASTIGPVVPAGPFDVGPVFLGLYGGPAIHLNGSDEVIANVGFGFFGGYTFFDGDWRLDLGGDISLVPYQVTDSDRDRTKYLTWFVNFAVVPAVRWTVLPELHLGASFGIGVGIFTPPSKTSLEIPWAGNKVTGALTIIHLRPALSLEYLPLDWLGIVVTPVAIDIDVPYSSGVASKTAALFRYDAFLGVAFHI